jgi:hypothetical protein
MSDDIKIRHSIMVFAVAMEMKLRLDDAVKKAWEECDIDELHALFLDERMEVDEAYYRFPFTPGSSDDLMMECVDEANQSMMIFSKLHPETQGNVRGHRQEPRSDHPVLNESDKYDREGENIVESDLEELMLDGGWIAYTVKATPSALTHASNDMPSDRAIMKGAR